MVLENLLIPVGISANCSLNLAAENPNDLVMRVTENSEKYSATQGNILFHTGSPKKKGRRRYLILTDAMSRFFFLKQPC